MKGLSSRVSVNVLTVLVVSTIVIIGMFLTYVSGVLFDDSYEVRVGMHEAGGVQPLQEVTVLGRAVGQVEDVELTEDGVQLFLSIQGEHHVPAEADVKVLRRSPIGEQAIDLQPVEAGWAAAEADSDIRVREATTPAEVPFLLEETADLFEALEPESVGIIFDELGTALDGRAGRLRNLNRDALELNRTLVGGIPEFERLLDTSEPVLATLREHRDDLADAFGSGADLTEIFAEQRPNLERLLDTGERSLDQLDVFVRNTRANLSCLNRDLTAFNEMLLGPSTYDGEHGDELYDTKLDELERALVANRYFLDLGYNIISQPDPGTGLSWTRVQLVLDEAENAERYDEHIPTPGARPGAACVSDEFGLGVNAVRQDDPVEPYITAPDHDYAPLHDGEREVARPSTAPGGDQEDPGDQGEPDNQAARDGAATGGGAAGGATTDDTGGVATGEGTADDDTADADADDATELEAAPAEGDDGARSWVDAVAVGVPVLVLAALGLLWLRRRSA